MITCFNDTFLKGTFSKFDNALTFLNTCTGGGFFKLRLIDQDLRKKSGKQIKVNGQFEDVGFKSEVVGINGAKASNIRGDRVDLLIYDEAGSWPGLDTAVVQGQELCEVQGKPRGTMLFGGTGRIKLYIQIENTKSFQSSAVQKRNLLEDYRAISGKTVMLIPR